MASDVRLIWRDGRLSGELWVSNKGDMQCSTFVLKTPQ